MAMNESGFIMFKNPEIFIDSTYNPDVDPAAINGVLMVFFTNSISWKFQEWVAGERQIKELMVYHIPYSHMKIFDNLNYFILWSQEAHESSPFHHLCMQNRRRQIWTIHSLEREDGVKIFVEISKNDGKMRLVAKEYQEIQEIEEWIHNIIQVQQ